MNKKLCKVLCLIACCNSILLFTLTNCFASSYSSYDGTNNNLSSTFVDYLKSSISDINPDEDYILFRDGEHSYILAVSPSFTFNSSTNKLTGEAELLRIYTQRSGTTQSYSDYRVQLLNDSNFSYTYDNHMIYSNCIPGIPGLQNASTNSFQLSYIFIGIGVLILLFVGFKALSVSKGGLKA